MSKVNVGDVINISIGVQVELVSVSTGNKNSATPYSGTFFNSFDTDNKYDKWKDFEVKFLDGPKVGVVEYISGSELFKS